MTLHLPSSTAIFDPAGIVAGASFQTTALGVNPIGGLGFGAGCALTLRAETKSAAMIMVRMRRIISFGGIHTQRKC